MSTCSGPEAQGYFVNALKDAKPAVGASFAAAALLTSPVPVLLLKLLLVTAFNVTPRAARGTHHAYRTLEISPSHAQALKHICADVALITAFTEWLAELLAARGGQHEHVLLALLEQLGRMPLRAAVLKQVR